MLLCTMRLIFNIEYFLEKCIDTVVITRLLNSREEIKGRLGNIGMPFIKLWQEVAVNTL